MNKVTTKVMVGFIMGQIVQIILHILANANYMRFPVLFCGAAGFLVMISVVAGITLADSEKKPEHKKSYMDYVQDADYESVGGGNGEAG